jgi:hypothetical protein
MLANESTAIHGLSGRDTASATDRRWPEATRCRCNSSLLVPGAAVFVIASKRDDGKLTSTRLYVEKDGIKPPM